MAHRANVADRTNMTKRGAQLRQTSERWQEAANGANGANVAQTTKRTHRAHFA